MLLERSKQIIIITLIALTLSFPRYWEHRARGVTPIGHQVSAESRAMS